MGIYFNFPWRATEVWVMGKPTDGKSGWSYLFKAGIGELEYYGERAWSPTLFERAVKKKCREYKKQGLFKSFEFCTKWDMRKYMDNGKSNFYKNFPIEDMAELDV